MKMKQTFVKNNYDSRRNIDQSSMYVIVETDSFGKVNETNQCSILYSTNNEDRKEKSDASCKITTRSWNRGKLGHPT
jgi:hypothetical protein